VLDKLVKRVDYAIADPSCTFSLWLRIYPHSANEFAPAAYSYFLSLTTVTLGDGMLGISQKKTPALFKFYPSSVLQLRLHSLLCALRCASAIAPR